MTNKILKIFISHAWADKKLSVFKEIENHLQDIYDVWIDVQGIEFGERIKDKLVQAIRESDVVLVLWSEAADCSEAVQFEIQTASELKKIVVPCIISDYSLDYSQHLQGRKYIDFYHDTQTVRGVDLGLMKLTQFLFRLEAHTPEFEAFKNQISLLNKTLEELEHIEYRSKVGDSGNEHGNAYLQSPMAALIKAISVSQKSPQRKRKLIRFFSQAQEISAQYPNPNQNSIKLKLIIQAVDAIDPEKSEAILQNAKQAAILILEKTDSKKQQSNC